MESGVCVWSTNNSVWKVVTHSLFQAMSCPALMLSENLLANSTETSPGTVVSFSCYKGILYSWEYCFKHPPVISDAQLPKYIVKFDLKRLSFGSFVRVKTQDGTFLVWSLLRP